MREFLKQIRRVIFYRTVFLEEELQRTRAELERWQNVVLVEKGYPPLTQQAQRELPKMKSRLLPSQYRSLVEKATEKKEANV